MIKLSFCGDAMCKASVMEAFKTDGGYDFTELFSDVTMLFKDSDYVCANLETPISYDNSDLIKEIYRFNSPYQFAEAMHDSGIDFVGTANNHCLNNGVKGISSTIKSLDKIGLAHTGTFDKQHKPQLIVRIGNVKVGFLAYTYGTNAFDDKNYLSPDQRYMVNMFQNQELSNPFDRWVYYTHSLVGRIARKLLRMAFPSRYAVPVYERRENDFRQKRQLRRDIKNIRSSGADIIVMLMHIGGQYNPEANSYTKQTTEWLFAHGVNIVVGMHEHVVHSGVFDRIADNQIATYSLGNFVGTSGVYEEPMDKLSEYSIAWNVFIDDNSGEARISKSTFSVLKIIETTGKKIKVIPCYDLYASLNDEDEKKKLLYDVERIVHKFSKKKTNEKFIIEQEYSL